MPSGMKRFLGRWLIGTVAVLVATYVVPGIRFEHWTDLLLATFLLGLLNTFVRPVLWWLSLPLVVVTLGLFSLVIHAALLLLVSWLLAPRFQVDGFWPALLAALVIWVITFALNRLTGSGEAKIQVHVRRGRPDRRPPDDEDGPIIDV